MNVSTMYAMVLSCILVFFLLYSHDSLVWQKVEGMVKNHRILAVLFLLSLFVWRVFFPLLPVFALYTMTGRLFVGNFVSLLVNLGGLALMASVTFLLGRYRHFRPLRRSFRPQGLSRIPILRHIFKLYEEVRVRTGHLLEKHGGRSLFLLTLSPFPQGTLGKLWGEGNRPFVSYLFLVLSGNLPRVLSATLLGMSLNEPTSPFFGLSFLLSITVSVSSLFFYRSAEKQREGDEKGQ